MSCKDKLISDLKARRKALGWSVKEVGYHTGLDQTAIARWEGGDASPRLEQVANWASALGFDLSLTTAEEEAECGLHVDWQARRISAAGTPVRLTPMEWKVLERLAAAPGETVSHLALSRHLYGENEPFRAHSTAIRVLITRLRRVLPLLRIEAQWGRGYIISGIAASSLLREPPAETAAEPIAKPAPSQSEKPPDAEAPTLAIVAPVRPFSGRTEELTIIERFLAERGVTRCPDVGTIQLASVPTLAWDKTKHKWVRPATEPEGR